VLACPVKVFSEGWKIRLVADVHELLIILG
jgi:hypothetical protein